MEGDFTICLYLWILLTHYQALMTQTWGTESKKWGVNQHLNQRQTSLWERDTTRSPTLPLPHFDFH